MALSVLRDIATNLHNGVHYTLMADEVTDSSNREQFVICIRWVDSGLIADEDLLGLYQVPDISSATLVQCLRDVLTRMSLSINNCRGQCYDGANNMSGIRSGVATQILKEEERALFTHCYGHALNLAVSDTVRKVKLLHDTLDTTSEISKLLKYSPKRDTMFEKLKKELAPETPGFRTLYPTRWTVKANSLKSVLDNFKPLTQLWEDSLETNLNSEIKSRIIGVKTHVRAFDYFFGLHLVGFMVMNHTDNLSRSLQGTEKSASQGQMIASMTVKTQQIVRIDESFQQFWQNVNVCKSASVEDVISQPQAPRKRRRQARLDDGKTPGDHPEKAEDYFRSVYFETLDLAINFILDRFSHPGYKVYSHLESLLLNAVNGNDFSEDLDYVCNFYGEDLERNSLLTQLQTLRVQLGAEKDLWLNDVVAYLKSLPSVTVDYFSEVFNLVRLILVVPATNAVSERSASALRRLKTYLRTTMSQERLNHCIILHVHKERTDKLNMANIGDQFVMSSTDRQNRFGQFSSS